MGSSSRASLKAAAKAAAALMAKEAPAPAPVAVGPVRPRPLGGPPVEPEKVNFEVGSDVQVLSQDCQERCDFRYLVSAFERCYALLFLGPVEDRHGVGRNGHGLPGTHGHGAAGGSGRVCAEALCHLLRASGALASKSVEAKKPPCQLQHRSSRELSGQVRAQASPSCAPQRNKKRADFSWIGAD